MTEPIVSGVFGLLVAVVAYGLAHFGQHRAEARAAHRDRRVNLESVYAEMLAALDLAIRVVEEQGDRQPILERFALANGRASLLSTPEILKQSGHVSDLMFHWSNAFLAGSPKRVSDTAVVGFSGQLAHTERAQELYPRLLQEIAKMIEMMRVHLEEMERKSLR